MAFPLSQKVSSVMLKLQYAPHTSVLKMQAAKGCTISLFDLVRKWPLREYTWLEWRIYLISHSWIRLIQIFVGGPSKRNPSLCNKWKQPGGMILC